MNNRVENNIHPSSVIEDGAVLGAGVKVGPFCHVGPNVTLGNGVELLGHVSIQGHTTIGDKTRIFPFASVGSEPQDMKYKGEHVTLEIGNECIIREGVTMNPGTEGGGSVTKVGDNCAFLANSHVAHDCTVGNNVIFQIMSCLLGTVLLEIMLFLAAVQGSPVLSYWPSRICWWARCVEGDLIPFGMAIGNRASLAGLNLIGMKRSGIDRESIHAVRGAYKKLFSGDQPVQEAANEMRNVSTDPLLIELLDFISASTDRALCTPDNQ